MKTENGPTLPTAGLAKTQSAPSPAESPPPTRLLTSSRKSVGRSVLIKVSKTMAKTRMPLRTSELNGSLENLDIELVDPSSPIRANFGTENATKEATALIQGQC